MKTLQHLNFKLFAILVLFFSITLVLGADKAFAATVIWDGGSAVDAKWSAVENWVGDVLPQDGDDIVLNCTGNHDCGSILDIDLTVNSIHFVGTGNEYAGVLADSIINAQFIVNGDITSDTPGSFINAADITLGADITVHNFTLSGGGGSTDLNGFDLLFTGTGLPRTNEIGNPTGPYTELGILGQIVGIGNITIDVDPNTEVHMVGDTPSTYDGTTTIVSGIVSTGRANMIGGEWVAKTGSYPTNTPYMFGNSDVVVEIGGKILFFLDEDNDGQSLDNVITLSDGSFSAAQFAFINITEDDSVVNFDLPNVVLQTNNRFDALTPNGDLVIDLAGINNNNQYCLVYGQDNLQAQSFINGPDCSDEEPTVEPEEPTTVVPKDELPGVPAAGAMSPSSIGFISLATVPVVYWAIRKKFGL